jgi:DNA-binding beta-propeller fold protein YncE
LYVALNTSRSLGIIDTHTLTSVQVSTGAFPYGTAVTNDGLKVYVSGTVSVFAANAASNRAAPSGVTQSLPHRRNAVIAVG